MGILSNLSSILNLVSEEKRLEFVPFIAQLFVDESKDL